MELTRAGVCYDLPNSPYHVTISYGDQNVKFMFSSKLNADKFKDRLILNRKDRNGMLSKQFGFEIEYDILCDIHLYNKIEKRGFYISANGKGLEWKEEVKLDGMILTRRS